MFRRFLSVTLAALFSLLTGAGLGAQVLERVPPPIDVRVAAETLTRAGTGLLVPQGVTVTIAGSTVPLGPKWTHVRVEVKPPSGIVAASSAPIAEDRSWSTACSGTEIPGKYVVIAYTADGKNSAATSFTVMSPEDIDTLAELLESAVSKGAADAAGAIAGARALSTRGPFPDQEKVEANLSEVNAALKELPTRVKAGRQGLAKLAQIAAQYPAGAKELEPLTTAIQEGVANTQEAAERMRHASAAAGKTLGVCDRIDAINEVLAAASLWFDLQELLFQKIVQLATDRVLSDRIYDVAVPEAKRAPTERFALGENLKAVAAAFSGGAIGGSAGAGQGLVDFVEKPQNLLLDTTQMLTGVAFDKLCEKFTGPVNGTFTVDATINGGEKFWGYTTAISGRLTLMYEKQLAHGHDPIPMTGEIEGHGSFQMYEDLMAFGGFNRQFVIYHALLPPVGTDAGTREAFDPLGRIARTGTPGYFRVPVKGTLKGNELTIAVGEAAYHDFSDAVKGRAVYVMLAPTAPTPYTLMSSLPVQKAQFILSRGLRMTAVLPVATASKGKTIIKTATKTFDRKDVVSNGEVTVTWKIDLKACNPECGS